MRSGKPIPQKPISYASSIDIGQHITVTGWPLNMGLSSEPSDIITTAIEVEEAVQPKKY